jgi:cell wall-associated NlpC family hydrolase
MPKKLTALVVLSALCASLAFHVPAAQAAPSWVRPALRYLADKGYVKRSSFHPNRAMTRRAFKRLMGRAFGGGYGRTRGKVTAGEVDAALVKVLGHGDVARRLNRVKSPDGWDPRVGPRFGTEIVARELGLRRDRPTTEEHFEASAGDRMRQADIVYAVYRAKVGPYTWGADALESFRLPNLSRARRKVVRFAFRQVGKPYFWSGEWPTRTPSGYPYGAQSHGGFDCSGFTWYVLRRKESIWSPNRPYRGWSLPERSSADIGRGASRRLRYRDLKPGDAVVFGSQGRKTSASALYHTGVYLGRGWMVHSSGSRAGVSLGYMGPGSYWRSQLAWGRRVIR